MAWNNTSLNSKSLFLIADSHFTTKMSWTVHLLPKGRGGALQAARWLPRKVTRNVGSCLHIFAQTASEPLSHSFNRNFITFLILGQFQRGWINFTWKSVEAAVSVPLDKHWATCCFCLTIGKSGQARHKSFVSERGTLSASQLFLF